MQPDTIPARQRRRFSPEFKRHLIEQCQPGVSVAAIATANGISPSQLQRWVRGYHTRIAGLPTATKRATSLKLVPVSVQSAQPVDSGSVIEIHVERKGGSVKLRWPVSDAASLSTLLTGWLR